MCKHNKFQSFFVSGILTLLVLVSLYLVTRPTSSQEAEEFLSRIVSVSSNAFVAQGPIGFSSKQRDSHKLIVQPEIYSEENVRTYAFTPDKIARLIKLQSDGSAGKLLTDGSTNLIYAVDADDTLFEVHVVWSGYHRGWEVAAWKRKHYDSGLSVGGYVVCLKLERRYNSNPLDFF